MEDKIITGAKETIEILPAGTTGNPLWETVCWTEDGECRWSRMFTTEDQAKAELERFRHLEDPLAKSRAESIRKYGAD